METVFIPAGREAIPAIRSMADIAFRATYADILSPDQMEYMMEWMYSPASIGSQMDSGHRYYIARDPDGRDCGYMSLCPDGRTPDGRARLHLQKLYVMPEFQGRGLGRRFFEKAVEIARGSAPCRLELNVNRCNPAVGFYEHLGMYRLAEGDFPIGGGYFMNDYIMALDLE